MNAFSCCDSCSGHSAENIFSLGSFIPPEAGYSQTYSFPKFNPVGVAGPLMGQPVARPYPGAPQPVFTTSADYPNRDGGMDPFYDLSKVKSVGRQAVTGFPDRFNPVGRQAVTGFPDRFNPVGSYSNTGNPTIFNPMGSYSNTGNPTIFNPMGSYSNTGNPAIFNPLGAYPSASRPTGITPVGEGMPAHIGHPARMGDGIGGAMVEPLGFMV